MLTKQDIMHRGNGNQIIACTLENGKKSGEVPFAA